jgi:hypothetical protein
MQPVAQRSVAAPKPSLFDSPAQIADSASPYAADPQGGGVIQGAKRQPVTSFNLDPARLGYNPTAAATATAQKGKKNVEF